MDIAQVMTQVIMEVAIKATNASLQSMSEAAGPPERNNAVVVAQKHEHWKH